MGTERTEGRFGAKIGDSLDIGTSFCLPDHWQKQQRSHIISRYRCQLETTWIYYLKGIRARFGCKGR